jgi:hypothetical protein
MKENISETKKNMNEIVVLDNKRSITPTELFTPKGIDMILAEVRKMAKSYALDVTTEEGRKEIASVAHKVSKTKVSLDNEGKKLTEEWARKKSLVDAERKKAREYLDKLRDEIRAPLNEFEEREEKRIRDCKERIEEIQKFKSLRESTEKEFLEAIDIVNKMFVYDWMEFEFKAKTITQDVINYLTLEAQKVKKQAEEKAELERLRKEKEERDELERKRLAKEREEALKRESAEKARKEAEEKALVERHRLELEAKEREKKMLADKEAVEYEKREALRKLKESEEKAKLATETALREERAREKAKKDIEEREKELREADVKHRSKINNDALSGVQMVIEQSERDCAYEELGKRIVSAIVKGDVPHVMISY